MTADYDAVLGKCRTLEDWSRFPPQDVFLFGMFGSAAPEILRGPHRLVKSNKLCFRKLLTVIGPNGAVPGNVPPTIARTGPDYGLNRSIPRELDAWKDGRNQEWLASRIESMKFMSARSIIFNADLPLEIASRIYFELPGSLPQNEWFRRVGELTKVCGWLYIPLSEEVEVDLLALSEVEERDKSGAIDATGCASRAEWRGDKLVFPMTPPTIRAREQ